MDAQNFCYWLHGFTELSPGQTPTPEQWKAICQHLDLVFKKVTPVVVAPRQKTILEMQEEYLKMFPNQSTGISPDVVYC